MCSIQIVLLKSATLNVSLLDFVYFIKTKSDMRNRPSLHARGDGRPIKYYQQETCVFFAESVKLFLDEYCYT